MKNPSENLELAENKIMLLQLLRIDSFDVDVSSERPKRQIPTTTTTTDHTEGNCRSVFSRVYTRRAVLPDPLLLRQRVFPSLWLRFGVNTITQK